MPGFRVEVYAEVTDPTDLTFDHAGAFYVGRDNLGSGGGSGDAVRIHRIGPGGFPVEEWGATAVDDPDTVAFDANGSISGVPGSVLVGGQVVGSRAGRISAILPDQNVNNVFGDLNIIREC